MEELPEKAVVIDVKWALPWAWACWNCLHLASSCLQWARRDWYDRVFWSCKWIQSLALWYFTACCNTIILMISLTSSLGNWHLLTVVLILLERPWIPSSGSCLRSDRSWLQWCQKCTSSVMTDWIALSAREGVHWASGDMVLLSMKVWGLGGLLPQTSFWFGTSPICSGLLHLDLCPGLQGSPKLEYKRTPPEIIF